MSLEYILHQIDNGQDFDQLDGFELILKLIDNFQNYNLAAGAARVISAAVQGNSKGLLKFITKNCDIKIWKLIKKIYTQFFCLFF